MQGSANLNVMIKAARTAARGLAKDFREVENLQGTSKSASDFVSRADIRAEEVIRETLMEARPNYGWLGEKSGVVEGKDPTRRWVAAPLAGRTNFLHGLPHWAVAVALEHKGEVVAGVVYDPGKDEMFVAEKGQGAWMNDTRLRVSDRSRMTEAVFATGIPFASRSDLPETLRDLARLLPQTAGVRHWGTAALDLAYVAAGRVDGCWDRHLDPWDKAAGIIIVREAGGLVEALIEGGDPLSTGGVLAANAQIFNSFARVLRLK